MRVEDVERIVAAYNRFAETWNRHERDPGLPLPPGKSDEGQPTGAHRPWSALWWIDNHTGRWCVIRVEDWCRFAPGHGLLGPALREPIDIDRVVWAGWLT